MEDSKAINRKTPASWTRTCPRPLKGILPNHTVTTVQEQGRAGTVNGALLARLEGAFVVGRGFLLSSRQTVERCRFRSAAISGMPIQWARRAAIKKAFLGAELLIFHGAHGSP